MKKKFIPLHSQVAMLIFTLARLALEVPRHTDTHTFENKSYHYAAMCQNQAPLQMACFKLMPFINRKMAAIPNPPYIAVVPLCPKGKPVERIPIFWGCIRLPHLSLDGHQTLKKHICNWIFHGGHDQKGKEKHWKAIIAACHTTLAHLQPKSQGFVSCQAQENQQH